MGSEEGICNSPIHVAVGKNVKEGKSLLVWAVETFPGRSIHLLHVYQPSISSASHSNGKPSGSKFKNRAIKAWQEFERLKMQKHMNQYIVFLSQMEKQADKVCIEMRNIEEGILQLISQNGITRLVMGAGAEAFSTKKCTDINTKAMIVCQQAPKSCHIWFVSKGCLVHERPVGCDSHSSTAGTLPYSTIGDHATLTSETKKNMDANGAKVQHFGHPTESIEEAVSIKAPSASKVSRPSKYEAPSLHLKVESPERLSHSTSSTSMDSEFQEDGSFSVRNKLKLWRAEENALEAARKAEAAEGLYREENDRRKEIEEQFLRHRQEMETMKNQQEQYLKELRWIEGQMPVLESRIRESQYSEEELEEKIIQAVNLLISFRGKRDELRGERDSAVRRINKYRALKGEDPLGFSSALTFEIPFSDIIETTQNFNPSQKIGDGKYGSVFGGTLNCTRVAIKMLPSSGSQSDWEFKNEAEVLSRVRHPNLVTLIGICPESRSLVYEYIDNGNLEEYLSASRKARSLSWQSRIKIAIDICSVLLFLHADSSCNHIHGNLRPSNILLDRNFVTKISDFGIYNLVSKNEEFVRSGAFTTEYDIYLFGIILLRLLTARPASGVMRDVKCSLRRGNLDDVLDTSAGDWPLGQAKQLASLALICCLKDRMNRADVLSEIWDVLEPMRELCNGPQFISTSPHLDSRCQCKIPSHFLCPIYQEVMKDPHIAPDGFTYEGEAIKGWFDSGHKTSPMTNLMLENCDLLPNYALYYAIQEWQQNT